MSYSEDVFMQYVFDMMCSSERLTLFSAEERRKKRRRLRVKYSGGAILELGIPPGVSPGYPLILDRMQAHAEMCTSPRKPHLVALLGACDEQCSLEDTLRRGD